MSEMLRMIDGEWWLTVPTTSATTVRLKTRAVDVLNENPDGTCALVTRKGFTVVIPMKADKLWEILTGIPTPASAANGQEVVNG